MRPLRSLALLALLAAALGPAVADVPRPRVEVDKSTQCVAPPAEMRRTHMDLLKHRRDRAVHEGVRDGKASLEACIDCHAGKTGAVIGSPDAFCQSCHAYAGVKLDCFECHQARRGAALGAAAEEARK